MSGLCLEKDWSFRIGSNYESEISIPKGVSEHISLGEISFDKTQLLWEE